MTKGAFSFRSAHPTWEPSVAGSCNRPPRLETSIVISQPDGAVAIRTAPIASEPGPRYIFHVAFLLSNLKPSTCCKSVYIDAHGQYIRSKICVS